MSKLNFTTPWESEYWMESNGLFCGFNMPDAVGESFVGLPPYRKIKNFLVDEYPLCPNNWLRSKGKTTSYFVPVKDGSGMWLDFNKNINHKYEVAIVVSVQGINAITGMPCEDDCLEQYIEKCPKHDIEFEAHRYCPDCKYKWPKQNYISTTGTEKGKLWIDGFRSAEGLIRQYILSKDSSKGVASNIIGEDRVYSIGISFFLSKDKKPEKISSSYLRGQVDFCEMMGIKNSSNWGNDFSARSLCCTSDWNSINSNDNNPQELTYGFRKSINVEKMEIGAGQKIDQNIGDDPNKLDFWRNESEAIIVINYCLEEEAIKILEVKKEQQVKQDGWLENIPVA
jgi:hypothetical protein